MVFLGTYEHTIDTKNRLSIPSELRGQIQRAIGAGEGDPLVLIVTLGEEQALRLYTEPVFERRAEELEMSEMATNELLDYERLFFSLARRVEVDRQGRVRLPENLVQMSGLESEIVLLGVKDHLEIRDRQTWQAHVTDMLANRRAMLMDPRGAMRQSAGGMN